MKSVESSCSSFEGLGLGLNSIERGGLSSAIQDTWGFNNERIEPKKQADPYQLFDNAQMLRHMLGGIKEVLPMYNEAIQAADKIDGGEARNGGDFRRYRTEREQPRQTQDPKSRAEQADKEWNKTLKDTAALPDDDTLGKLSKLTQGLAQSQYLWRNVPEGSKPGGPDYKGNEFDLDGKRSAKEILEQGVGGSCGSYGKVLADALIKTGTDPNRVYIVDTVGESERHRATEKAKTGDADKASASGHQFLLVQDKKDKWHLIDTTADKLDEIAVEGSPQDLQKRLSDPDYAKNPVRIHPAEGGADGGASFPNLVESIDPKTAKRKGPPATIFGDLVVFSVQQAADYKNHDIKQRVEEVARVVPKP